MRAEEMTLEPIPEDRVADVERDEVSESLSRLRLLSVEDLLARQPPRWLIDEVVPDESFVVLYGRPEEYKTFVALDVALHLAAGRSWHGRAVKGPEGVVYVAPEGFGGLGKRVKAWLVHHELSAEHLARLKFVDVPVGPKQTSDFLAAVKSSIGGCGNSGPAPRLVVFDTLAKCMVGGDENSTKDMGLFIDCVDTIRREFDSTVLVVHHVGKDTHRGERGSSALRGAADAMLRAERSQSSGGGSQRLFLRFDKMKDHERPKDLELTLRKEVMPDGEDSLVVSGVVARDRSHETKGHRLDAWSLLSVLVSDFDENGATDTEWKKAAEYPQATYYRHKKQLVKEGYVEKRGKARGARFVPTPKGRSHLVSPGYQ